MSASYNPSNGLGLGWHAEASLQQSRRASTGIKGNSSQAEWALDLASDARGQVAARASGRGTLGWLAGMPFASRAVGHGSFVVVDVGGLEGVSVMRSHQLVAKTDSRGLAFVPGLLPWQQNRIEIDLLDLPLDVEAGHTVQQVTPYARSGSVARFAVRRTRQALFVLHQPGGQPVPAGAQVQLQQGGPEFRVGRRGEVWLVDLAAERQRLQVRWPGGGCLLELTELPASGTTNKIGPLICTKDSKSPDS
jgi:outer membrane usher protein